ncbi:MAG: hypothetical protein PUB10_00305, partial [Clostridiales bacterium]|nr:hypothetical protein [Clostridiales bacterium]
SYCWRNAALALLRVQWSESGYFMVPDILHASGGCALVTAELLRVFNMPLHPPIDKSKLSCIILKKELALTFGEC